MIDLPPLHKLYRGNSMRRVFRNGEQIYLESVSFSQVRRGDVLVFQWKDGNWIIHRAVKKSAEEIITRGDNCENCDSEALTLQHELFRATYVSGLNGKLRPVRNGRSGCWQCSCNRLRRRVWSIVAGGVNHLLPLMWWRRSLFGPIVVGTVEHFMAGGKVVAVRHNGVVEFKKSIKKIFYKLPSEDEKTELSSMRQQQVIIDNSIEAGVSDENGEIPNGKK
ncbi:MAG: hypothetical protein RR060_04740 [Victivallaceae bacterium]